MPVLDTKYLALLRKEKSTKSTIKITSVEVKTNIMESLIEKPTDYGKTSCELVKCNFIDKASDVVSMIIPYSIILIIGGCFMLFLN